jgi:hypothetical protein
MAASITGSFQSASTPVMRHAMRRVRVPVTAEASAAASATVASTSSTESPSSVLRRGQKRSSA